MPREPTDIKAACCFQTDRPRRLMEHIGREHIPGETSLDSPFTWMLGFVQDVLALRSKTSKYKCFGPQHHT